MKRWLDKYNDELPQAQYGCDGKSCTPTGEGRFKIGSRLNGASATGSGGSGDGSADTKKAYWAKVKNQYKAMGIKEEDFNNAFEDSMRIGNQFMNPNYAKDFDPNTGKLKPGVSPAAYSGNLRYYAQAPGFKFGQMPTINQILELQAAQPGGLKGYRNLVKEDYPFGINPQREYGGPVSKYQDGGSKVSGRSEVDKKLTAKEASKLREENVKGAQQWLTDWYTKRATLPQFTGIANERVEALKTLPKMVNLPVQSLKDMGAQAYYQSVGNKMILPGESTSASLNRRLEKKGLGTYDYIDDSGKILSDYSGMSKPTIAHELGHYLADVAPQGIAENKRSGSPLFPQIDFVPGKETNLEPTFYNWITSPGKIKGDVFQKGIKYNPEVDATMVNFRMLEGLDPTKVYTAEDFKPIIEKYKKLNLTPEYINTEKGDKERLVKYLMESIGNDPEKLAELQNTIVRTSSKRSDNKAQYGKELNYNNASVSLPDGFEGMGYNTQGRNYSPAWGGQFAMGGSLPGAVGFTYARTGSIPSNGPYAKKTLASAENGTEMSYYQHGLDWKPKSISKNGSVIEDDRGQWAHPGEITEIQGNSMATHGYGDIPLYVVPDVGEPRMVEANTGNHTFPGATKFTEYPIKKKKNGRWLDKYN